MKFKKYSAEAIKVLLKTMDANLHTPYEVILVGGAAATLAYGVELQTQDIDTYNDVSPLLKVYRQAVLSTGLEIPFEKTSVFDAPYHFEDRLKDISQEHGLKLLRVKVPEKHDLALMKILRGNDNDLYAIEQIHRNDPLDLDTLVTRFTSEMKQVVGRFKDIRLKFLMMISLLYGDEIAEAVEKKL